MNKVSKNKAFMLVILILSIISIVGCSKEDTHIVETEVDKSKDEIETDVEVDTETDTETDEIIIDIGVDAETDIIDNTEEEVVKIEPIDVIITDKVSFPVNYDLNRYSEEVYFEIDITNKLDKSIKGIQGSIEITDMFGKHVINIGCDLVGTIIKPQETVTNSNMAFDVNQFIAEDMKVYNLDYSDLNFKYTVSKIVFEDGEMKEY